MQTVLSLAALKSTEYFESQTQRRKESSGFIDLFTLYYTAATPFLSQLFLPFCNSFVLLTYSFVYLIVKVQ